MTNKPYQQIFDVKGKVVLVTGGGRGNGSAIVDGFLAHGAIVYVLDKAFSSTEKRDRCTHIECDLTALAALPEIVDNISKQEGRLDVLVNNAGISVGSDTPYDLDILENTFAINLKAAYVLSAEVVKTMKRQSTGSIINITSLGASQGFPGNPSYQVSKAGLKQLSKAMAIDFGADNIRVNNICPGYIKTKMTEKSYNDSALNEDRRSRMALNRWGDSEDLIGACIFLASEASSYITGAEIPVDGGWLTKGL